jgi:hypothetical protein
MIRDYRGAAKPERCFVVRTDLDVKQMMLFQELYDGFESVPLGDRIVESLGQKYTQPPISWPK